MSWVTNREAAAAWGLKSAQGVHKRCVRRPDQYFRARDPDRPDKWLYWVGAAPPTHGPTGQPWPGGQGAANPPAAPPPEHPEPSAPPSMKHRPGEGWIQRNGYIYDGTRDVYIITLPSHRAPFVLTGDRLRSIWRKYAGDQATIAEVCRDFAIDHQTFKELKRALNLTKSRSPHTDEEIEALDENTLATDLLRAKERRVSAKAQAANWRRIEKLANNRQWLRDTIADALAGVDHTIRIPEPTGAPDELCVVVGWSDLHVGKRTAGKSQGLKPQVDALLKLGADVVARVAALAPECVVIACTGDLIHSDSQGQHTTRGTPQGPQSEGSTAMALRAACEVTHALVRRLASIVPKVVVVVVPGNHDELLSRAVGLYLEAAYMGASRVSIHAGEHTRRKWIKWRQVPLCLFHGDKLKGDRLSALPGRECPAGADPRRAVLIHGHLHKSGLRQDVVGGFDVVCVASPAAADDWHHDHGFEGARRAITLVCVAPDGLAALEWVRAD